MDNVQKQLVRAVSAEFAKHKRMLEPRLLEMAKAEAPLMADEEIRNIQYAQNVLRTCMEACLRKMLPYTHKTSTDLAIRLASYALSIVPAEDQDYVMNEFMRNFLLAHETRMANGIRIHTDWQMENGEKKPNFSTGPIVPKRDT